MLPGSGGTAASSPVRAVRLARIFVSVFCASPMVGPCACAPPAASSPREMSLSIILGISFEAMVLYVFGFVFHAGDTTAPFAETLAPEIVMAAAARAFPAPGNGRAAAAQVPAAPENDAEDAAMVSPAPGNGPSDAAKGFPAPGNGCAAAARGFPAPGKGATNAATVFPAPGNSCAAAATVLPAPKRGPADAVQGFPAPGNRRAAAAPPFSARQAPEHKETPFPAPPGTPGRPPPRPTRRRQGADPWNTAGTPHCIPTGI